jgi:KDO2-lipid IV(A) lauroyltransferase
MSVARILQVLEYGLARAGMAAALSIGPSRALRVARGAADLLYRLNRKHRERALANLLAVFPDRSEDWRKGTARSSFRSFATTIVESLYLHRLARGASVRRRITFHIDPAVPAAVAGGRGAVFATAHVGNWEWTGALAGFFGYPLLSIARPLANPWLTEYMRRHRERTGQKIAMKRGALRESSRTLRTGGYLGFLVDQSAGRHGVFADFFGRPASTTGAPATLALKYDVPLIPASQRRLPGEFRHEVFVEAPLPRPMTGDRTRDVFLLTAAMNARVEAWVRREPGQWLWAHRRWKTKPPGMEEACRPSPSTLDE